ncbi:hypothetical protein TcCL_NonESM06431 [Trypanosoma cruzi]|nr:hypothetical protein TcCL_NonESM06431 [Trypanosoma cruzi]
MRSRCATTSATSSHSNSSVSSTSSTIAGMPRLRNTHSATISCRLSSPIMSAKPNAYCHTCSMRRNHPPIRLAVMHCISVSSLCLEQTLTPLDPRPGCCERLPRGATFVEEANVRKQRPPSLPQTSPLAHTKGRCHGKGKSAAQCLHKSMLSSNAIHVALQQRALRTTHKRQQRERRGTSKVTALFFTSHRRDGLALRSTLTVRHGAHHPLLSVCTQQAGAQSPSCHRNGEQKQ